MYLTKQTSGNECFLFSFNILLSQAIIYRARKGPPVMGWWHCFTHLYSSAVCVHKAGIVHTSSSRTMISPTFSAFSACTADHILSLPTYPISCLFNTFLCVITVIIRFPVGRCAYVTHIDSFLVIRAGKTREIGNASDGTAGRAVCDPRRWEWPE